MRRLAWLGAGFAAGVAFALPRVLNLEGELGACDDADRDSARAADRVERPPPGAEFVEHEGELYSVEHEGELYSVDPVRPWVLLGGSARDGRGLPRRRERA